jgi:hypothetical protein
MFFWEHTEQFGCFPFQRVVRSNGCYGQFKSSRAWFFVGWYPSLTSCATLAFKLPNDLELLCFRAWEGGNGWCKNVMKMRNSQKASEVKWVKAQ